MRHLDHLEESGLGWDPELCPQFVLGVPKVDRLDVGSEGEQSGRLRDKAGAMAAVRR